MPEPSKGRTRRTSKPRSQRESGLDHSTDPPRLWVTAGLNIQILPFNGANYSFGYSQTASGDTVEDILKQEAEMFKVCEQIVDRRVRQQAKTILEVRAEMGIYDDEERPEEWDLDDEEEDEEDWDE